MVSHRSILQPYKKRGEGVNGLVLSDYMNFLSHLLSLMFLFDTEPFTSESSAQLLTMSQANFESFLVESCKRDICLVTNC